MKNYFKKVFKVFKIIEIIKESILLLIFISIIDYLNCLSSLYRWNIFITIIILLFIIISFITSNNLKKINMKSINELDRIIFILLFFSIFELFNLLFFNYAIYKIILNCILIFLLLLIISLRVIFYEIKFNKNLNIIDLKELYDNEIDINNYMGLAMMEEADVNYDLLNRNNIINQLYNAIKKSQPSKNFTIGLNGKWGSGKTTIFNNVMEIIERNNELNDYVIIKLDPWKYSDEKIMLDDFLNLILKKINYNIFNYENTIIIQNVINSIFDPKYTIVSKLLINEIKNQKNIPKLDDIVNDYLQNNHKKMLIIIDNMDRIDSQKAYFLIKCLDSVLNFKNTINLLLYDEEIINNILKNDFNFNEKYMEKIVQLKIDVPIADTNTIDNIKNKVASHLLYKDVPIINFINIITYKFENIRELKRFLNSSILLATSTGIELNSEDCTLLKYIQLRCPKLYYEIWNNKKFFMLYDRKYEPEIYSFDNEKLNKEAREYFNSIYDNKDYEPYIMYLEKLFPFIKNTNYSNQEIFSSYVNESGFRDSVLNNRIFNTRYFDLYFTNESNDFTRLRHDVINIINYINENNDYENKIKELVLNYTSDEQKVFFEILDLDLERIDNKKFKDLIICLFNMSCLCSNRVLFFELDSKTRINIIISKLLSKINIKEYNDLSKIIFKEVRKLSVLSDIRYWIDVNKKKGIVYSFDYESLYNKLCLSIFKSKINIYDKTNYCRGNIWSLYKYNAEKTRKYIKEIINDENIYLILNDLITISTGSGGYGYYISDENINYLIPNININNYFNKDEKELDLKFKFVIMNSVQIIGKMSNLC